MFTRVIAAALFTVAGTGAFAVTNPITITQYANNGALNDQFDTLTNGQTFVQEDFERFMNSDDNATVEFETGTPREAAADIFYGELTGSGISTNVGTIRTYGDFTGSGSTCQGLDLAGDDCDNIALQFSPDLNGQGNISPVGGEWSLNAADTGGFIWEAMSDQISSIGQIIFAIRDAADQGATVTVETEVGGEIHTETRDGLGNDNLQLITIDFMPGVTNAVINIFSSRRNDSMTLDGLALVAAPSTPPAVPLPATGLMLLGGLGMFGLSRRKARRAS